MHCRTNLVVATFVALSVAGAPVRDASARRAALAPDAAADKSGAATPDSLSDEAVAAFKAGEYDKAISLFEQAYALDPQPNYLFNIGRVYEEKGDLEKAVTNYQEFVKQPGVDLAARETATARLKVLRQTLDQLREQNEPKNRVEPGIDAPTPAEEAEAAKKRKLRLAGYSLLGVGGGVLVIGAVFGGLAVSKSNDAKDAAFIDDKLALRQEAKSRAVVGDGLLISGGVLAAVGLVLVLVTLGKGGGKRKAGKSPRNDRTAARTLSWQPLLSPTSRSWNAGLSLAGSF